MSGGKKKIPAKKHHVNSNNSNRQYTKAEKEAYDKVQAMARKLDMITIYIAVFSIIISIVALIFKLNLNLFITILLSVLMFFMAAKQYLLYKYSKMTRFIVFASLLFGACLFNLFISLSAIRGA